LKIKFLLLFLILSFGTIFSQEDAWVYFNDKPSETYYFENPLEMLTQRSLDRRARYEIPLDSKDVPIETTYITQIKNAPGITVLAKSKWLNALHIQGVTITDITKLEALDFVKSIEFANKSLNKGSKEVKSQQITSTKKMFNTLSDYDYGQAANQITMLNADELHLNNFTGDGMCIAVIDGGFPEVNNLTAFSNTKILGGYNFVDRNPYFYTRNYHGTAVLSTIAGVLESGVNGATSNFVGTAPDASFYLFITEDTTQEIPLEESLWVEAAEVADSLGVDVINSSLGYSVFFDNPSYNYSYIDMNGSTSFISRGAEIAFSRGMIVVNSVGNEGSNASWPYMNAPADAPSVLSIGAVDGNRVIASFSSYGPTSDNRIKPDVSARGVQSYVINTSGNVATGSGTSFSSPIMAGAVACLWQAFPNKTNAEITKLIKESAHLYNTPNNHEGYGIPNFKTIFEAIDEFDDDRDGVLNSIDLCENTPIGAIVDAQGCLLLPSDNFNIEVISETCPDKNNGQLTITSKTSYDYVITMNNLNYSFTNNTLTIIDLETGEYELCIFLANQNFSQCYTFSIEESVEVAGKVTVSSKSAIINLTDGTAPFKVYINGIERMETTSAIIEVAINNRDLIEVKTSINCEGVFSKEIVFDDLVNIFPNPITSTINFNFPDDISKLTVSVFNTLGSNIYNTYIDKSKPYSDISFLPKGIYFIKVEFGNDFKTFKIQKI
jgi:hypothetical protein